MTGTLRPMVADGTGIASQNVSTLDCCPCYCSRLPFHHGDRAPTLLLSESEPWRGLYRKGHEEDVSWFLLHLSAAKPSVSPVDVPGGAEPTGGCRWPQGSSVAAGPRHGVLAYFL